MQFSDKKFPKLDDTSFPDIDTVDVYRFKNTFDYTRWNKNTKITLTNVLWNSDYKDVVKFDSDVKRDEYFDNITDRHTIKLASPQRIIPDAKSYNYVDLPIPYDVAARYNYIIVEVPIATGESNPIDYETAYGVRRWYFFLDDISYASPSNTTCYVTLDVWTNFINNVTIKYMVLERGHAPVSITNTDDYLANPIANSKYLLAPDVDFGGEQITRNSKFVPFGNGKKYVCFATTVAPWNLQNIGVIAHPDDSSFTPPTYYDESFRSGFQFGVNGYGFGNGNSYNDLRTFGDNVSGNRLNNNVTVYAIPANERNSFLADVKAICPNFLRMIVACFVVSEEMITFANGYTVANHMLYEVAGNEYEIDGFNVNKNMFGYPERYQKYAKLYTYPYATLEISDNNGKSVEVRIENTGDVKAHVAASVAFPYLNLRCFFSGINGVGSTNYSWQRLDNTIANRNMPNNDWFKYCFDMDIPTYAIYMDGETSFMLDGYSSGMDNARRQALVSYQNGVRSANTSAENAIDSSNVANENAHATADTSVVNNDNDCNTKRTNADIVIATNTANTAADNDTSAQINTNCIVKNSQEISFSNGLLLSTTETNNQVTAATTSNSNTAMIKTNVIQGTIGGAQSGLATGTQLGSTIGGVFEDIGSSIGGGAGAAYGVLIGAGIGVAESCVTSGIEADCSTSNAIVITQAAETVAKATKDRNDNLSRLNAETSGANQILINDNKTNQTARNNQAFSSQTNNNIATSRTNCSNNANTAKSNADRTKDNSIFCTNENRYTSIDNAKNVLENTQAAALARVRDAQRKQPISVCSYGGEFAPDYNESKGIQVRVKTQNESAIAQAGDTFARYGYALNQAWNVEESGLKLMNNFTYWKADDIWIDDTEAANNKAIRTLTDIFNSGVTVWNDADKIGKVSVYDN